jgi:hypothetical protein
MIEVETKNASLDTLAVTILALHVSGKQMTQAVFKQLPEGDEKENEPIWGIVRYRGIYSSHSIWIIFSSEGTLYKRELKTQRPEFGWVAQARRELDIHDNRYPASTINYEKDRPETIEWKRELAQKRIDLVYSVEECQSAYDESLVKQQNELALSKLKQLFIAV